MQRKSNSISFLSYAVVGLGGDIRHAGSGLLRRARLEFVSYTSDSGIRAIAVMDALLWSWSTALSTLANSVCEVSSFPGLVSDTNALADTLSHLSSVVSDTRMVVARTSDVAILC